MFHVGQKVFSWFLTKRKRISIKSVVTYTCKYGFMVVGDATRTCGEDKQWSGLEPKVKEVLLSHTAGSVRESNRFGCCSFSCADLRCKFKLHLIESG